MIISRYIFRQTASALLLILFALTLIVWLTSILREIKLLTSQGQTFILFLQITSLAIPNLLTTVAPIAFLIAALNTLNRLNGDSEIIVLSAAGASVWTLFRPIFAVALCVSAGVLVANLYLLPAASRLLNTYVSQVRADVLAQVLQPGEFSDLEKGLTFHIRDKAPNGDLLGVVVHDERDKKTVTTVVSERGQVLSDGGRAAMELADGQIIRQSQEQAKDAQIVVFQTYTFDIGDFTQKTGPREVKPRERDIGDLLSPRDVEYYKANRPRFRSEIHDRFSAVLFAPLFALIALIYLGRPRTTREGRASILFTAFLAGAMFRIVGIAAISMAGKKGWAVGLVYGAPALGIMAGFMMLQFGIQPPALSLPNLKLPGFLRSRRPVSGAVTRPS